MARLLTRLWKKEILRPETSALLLDVMAGYDPGDPITAFSTGRIPKSYTHLFRTDALRGARIGVMTNLFGTAQRHRKVNQVMEDVITIIEAECLIDAGKGLGKVTELDCVEPSQVRPEMGRFRIQLCKRPEHRQASLRRRNVFDKLRETPRPGSLGSEQLRVVPIDECASNDVS